MKKLFSLGATLLLLASACGGGSAKESLTGAIENLSELEGLEMVFTVHSSPDSLAAMSTEGESLSDEDAQKILNSSITVRTKGDRPEESQAEFVLNVDGENDVEMKVLQQTLYARADVRGLIETFGGDASGLDEFEQQASAAGVTFITPAIAGEWIAFEGLKEIAQQQGFPTARAPNQDAFVRAFQNAVEDEADVSQGDLEGPGTHLVVDLPVRQIYERLVPEFQKLLGGMPGATLPPASEVPNENVRVDVWVEDDQLRQVRLDLLQFAQLEDEPVPEGVDELALQVTIDEFTDDVEAPQDAVVLTEQDIKQAFGALLMGGTSVEAGTAEAVPLTEADCKALEQMPPETQKQFVAQCPNLN
jgi:hypothetical protein